MSTILEAFSEKEQEFAFAWTFEPDFVVGACYNGCFPMAVPIGEPYFVFALKLHVKRCLVATKDIHVSKSTKKRSKNYTMSINTCFDEVMKQCHAQHGENWLCERLRRSFKFLAEHRSDYPVKFHSIEVWENGNLIAGELGYSTGSIYTSLTGFYNVNNTGSVQLCALGKLLERSGFEYWDFGMELGYKKDLGSKTIPRAEWISLVQSTRDKVVGGFACGTSENPKESCLELINWNQKKESSSGPITNPTTTTNTTTTTTTTDTVTTTHTTITTSDTVTTTHTTITTSDTAAINKDVAENTQTPSRESKKKETKK